jgi:hypothetical protein
MARLYQNALRKNIAINCNIVTYTEYLREQSDSKYVVQKKGLLCVSYICVLFALCCMCVFSLCFSLMWHLIRNSSQLPYFCYRFYFHRSSLAVVKVLAVLLLYTVLTLFPSVLSFLVFCSLPPIFLETDIFC